MSKFKKPEIDPNRSLSIEEFCWAENMKPATYRKIRQLGYGPVEDRVPGVDKVWITPKARDDYHKRLQSREVLEQVEKERQRKAAIVKKAGDLAAKSPRHIANIRKRASAAKRRPMEAAE